MRGIQQPRAAVLKLRSLGVLDRLPSRTMTADKMATKNAGFKAGVFS
jgi:hypothetical protein